MKNIKKTLFIFFALGIALFSRNANAQNAPSNTGFSINPFFQEINIKAGQERVPFSLEVKNNTAVTMVFRISVLDFGSLSESGGVAFTGSANNLKYGLASWINLQNDSLVMNPGETQIVSGNIENRDSLSPGGHYGAIFFKIEDNENVSKEEKNVAFDPSFASLLFVRKNGGETYGLNLKNIDFANNIFNLTGFIGLRFQNTGNVHAAPRGIIDITDPIGRKIQTGIINEQSGIILPETFRVFSSKMMELAKAFIPGKYRLEVAYRYDGKDDFTKESRSFFFVPPIFSFSVIAIIVLVVGFYLFNKKKKNKPLK